MDKAQPLWERSADILARQDLNTSLETCEDLRLLNREAGALEPSIGSIENVFFAEVESLLSESQAPLVVIIKMRRERLRAEEGRSRLPGIAFDLDDTIFARVGLKY